MDDSIVSEVFIVIQRKVVLKYDSTGMASGGVDFIGRKTILASDERRSYDGVLAEWGGVRRVGKRDERTQALNGINEISVELGSLCNLCRDAPTCARRTSEPGEIFGFQGTSRGLRLTAFDSI
jgi:hypothetical protein